MYKFVQGADLSTPLHHHLSFPGAPRFKSSSSVVSPAESTRLDADPGRRLSSGAEADRTSSFRITALKPGIRRSIRRTLPEKPKTVWGGQDVRWVPLHPRI